MGLHARTVSKATELGDSAYLARSKGLLQLLLAASAGKGHRLPITCVLPYFLCSHRLTSLPALCCPPPPCNQQRLQARTVSKATELADAAYLARSKGLLQLLLVASAAAESYLAPGMSNIAAASKVNTVFRNAWAKTPQVRREGGVWRVCVCGGGEE